MVHVSLFSILYIKIVLVYKKKSHKDYLNNQIIKNVAGGLSWILFLCSNRSVLQDDLCKMRATRTRYSKLWSYCTRQALNDRVKLLWSLAPCKGLNMWHFICRCWGFDMNQDSQMDVKEINLVYPVLVASFGSSTST
jgi:hypothetical protein